MKSGFEQNETQQNSANYDWNNMKKLRSSYSNVIIITVQFG